MRTTETLRRPSAMATVALMPLDVELTVMTASGMQEPRADWTEAAHRNLTAAFQAEQQARGLDIRVVDEASLSEQDRARIAALNRLHGAVGATIMLNGPGGPLPLPSKGSRLAWSLGPAAAAIRTTTNADYGLFVWLRDSYTSPERAAVIVAAAVLSMGRVALQGGQQVGYASLVDLSTGEVIWFNRLARSGGDLRGETEARETAGTLLSGLPK